MFEFNNVPAGMLHLVTKHRRNLDLAWVARYPLRQQSTPITNAIVEHFFTGEKVVFFMEDLLC
jgi:hypothetical protein